MSENTDTARRRVSAAIDVVADHVERHADVTAVDSHDPPWQPEQYAKQRASILPINQKLRGLSKDSLNRKITYQEFEAVLSQLTKAGFGGAPYDDTEAVRRAIEAC